MPRRLVLLALSATLMMSVLVTDSGAAGHLRTSSFLGGSSIDDGFGLAVMPGGDVLVAGVTTSSDFPGAADGDAPVTVGEDDWYTLRGAIFVTRLANL